MITLITKWLSLLEIDLATQIQIWNEAVCISHSWKNMKQTILPKDIGK